MNRRQALKCLASLPLVAGLITVDENLPDGVFKSEDAPMLAELINTLIFDQPITKQDFIKIKRIYGATVEINDKYYVIPVHQLINE